MSARHCKSRRRTIHRIIYWQRIVPPFVGWMFRNSTDGRTATDGVGTINLTAGAANDRHKFLPGWKLQPILILNPYEMWTITATQQFRFYCNVCGTDAIVPGTHSGPHTIVRRFFPKPNSPYQPCNNRDREWRFTTTKHGITAWMDLSYNGYLGDSVGSVVSPPWWPMLPY